MIRPATLDDVPALLGLIRELADYEHEPDAVEATEESLRAVLFGPDPAVFALVAEHAHDERDHEHDEGEHHEVNGPGGEVVGCAIWFVSFSTWTGRHGIYLEDLVVREAARGHGYGRELLTELARIAVTRGYSRLEWSVLDWNEPALRFYRSLGAVAMDGWTVHRLAGEALAAVAGG